MQTHKLSGGGGILQGNGLQNLRLMGHQCKTTKDLHKLNKRCMGKPLSDGRIGLTSVHIITGASGG